MTLHPRERRDKAGCWGSSWIVVTPRSSKRLAAVVGEKRYGGQSAAYRPQRGLGRLGCNPTPGAQSLPASPDRPQNGSFAPFEGVFTKSTYCFHILRRIIPSHSRRRLWSQRRRWSHAAAVDFPLARGYWVRLRRGCKEAERRRSPERDWTPEPVSPRPGGSFFATLHPSTPGLGGPLPIAFPSPGCRV